MRTHPSHKKHVDALKRVEGQIRGIARMIEEKRYCVDILTQLSAAASAITSVQNSVLERHLDTCFTTALAGSSGKERKKKTSEIVKILKNFRKGS